MGYLELAKELKVEKSNHSPTLDVEISAEEHPMIDRENFPIDQLTRSLGFMVGISGELYFATLSKNSSYKVTMIFIEKAETGWEARRETFVRGRRCAVGTRKIVSNKEIKTVLKTVKNYLHSIKIVTSP